MDVKEGPGLGEWLLFLLLWILRCFFFNLYLVFFFLFLSVLDILKGSEVNGGVVLGDFLELHSLECQCRGW